MSRTNRTLFQLAKRAPVLVRLNMAFSPTLLEATRLVERLVYKMADVVKALVHDPRYAR